MTKFDPGGNLKRSSICKFLVVCYLCEISYWINVLLCSLGRRIRFKLVMKWSLLFLRLANLFQFGYQRIMMYKNSVRVAKVFLMYGTNLKANYFMEHWNKYCCFSIIASACSFFFFTVLATQNELMNKCRWISGAKKPLFVEMNSIWIKPKEFLEPWL